MLIAHNHTGTAQRTQRRFMLRVLAFAVMGMAVAAPGAARASTSQPSAQAVQVTLTTTNMYHALTAMSPLTFGRRRPRLPLISVNDAIRYQQVQGFGAALTDSSAWLLYDQLSAAARAQVLRALFGSSGIDLNFVRVPIAASDFSATGVPYSYDDLPAGTSDPNLASFSVAHDQAYVMPTLNQILAINPSVFTLATPWTAPPWMKATDVFGNLLNAGVLLPTDYRPFAEYFVRFIEAYASAGIPISAVTPENEPTSGAPFPAMELDEPAEATFINQYLAPALAAAGLHTRIFGFDEGRQLGYAEALVSGPAQSDLSGLAWHCYGGMDLMSALHQQYPAVNQIVSECSPGISHYTAAEAAIDAMRNWAGTVALWNLALDPLGGPVEPPNTGCTGCTPLVTVSEQFHSATFRLNYFEFGQLSKFVQPGAVRIASSRFVSDVPSTTGYYGVTPGLDNVAFLNPNGTRVLVVSNNSTTKRAFAVGWRGKYVTYALPRRGVATFVWR
jgi:glucosylceramidase